MPIEIFWNDFLYRPIFNGLIWIYNNWTDQSMGWAVVYLTILLRVVLLPFSIIDERDKHKNEALVGEIERIQKGYKDDPVMQKEEVRKILKTRKVQPWARAVVLGIQALVLVLLYQVFIQGITGDRMIKTLYTSIDFPGTINTQFLGFDIGKSHDFIWSGAIGLWVLIETYLSFKNKVGGITKSDLTYFILFPLSVFVLLWMLPMVKSLFILTSILFSVIFNRFIRLFVAKEKPSEHT